MKHFTAVTIASLLLTALAAAPAFASTVRANGATSGRPVAAYSNPGSVQGQVHRSSSGTYHKTTSDGYRMFW